jgi:ribulose 1,5-bisphosphate synthetase/thiazole synthase
MSLGIQQVDLELYLYQSLQLRMTDCIKTNVFVSGGDPVGLLVAHGLARQGVDSLLVGKSLFQALE